MFEHQIVTIMAKLVTQKDKYGISVAARIEPNLAYRISKRAETLGLSMAKMVSMLIAKGFTPEQPIVVDNSEAIEELDARYRTAIAMFIKQTSYSDEEYQTRVQLFHQIWNENEE